MLHSVFKKSNSILEQFIENSTTLPDDLYKNMTVLRELDEKVQDITNNTGKLIQNGELNEKVFEENFQKVVELSDEKIQLATQSYETLDKAIRLLDDDLQKFTNLLNEEQEKKGKQLEIKHSASITIESPKIATPVVKKKKRERSTSEHHGGSTTSKTPHTGGEKKKRKRHPPKHPRPQSSTTSSSKGTLNTKVVSSSVETDMPIDPNEPRYCYCRQVSHGQMVCCDDDDCEREWFHFNCVGLTQEPEGIWFCPDCTAKRKEKEK